MTSPTLANYCTKADILPQLQGSDHCPIFADFNIPKEYLLDNEKVQQTICTEFGGNTNAFIHSKQKKLKMCSLYLSDFSTRRSIKDMFLKKNKTKAEKSLNKNQVLGSFEELAKTKFSDKKVTGLEEQNVNNSSDFNKVLLKNSVASVPPKLKGHSKIKKTTGAIEKRKNQKSITSFLTSKY